MGSATVAMVTSYPSLDGRLRCCSSRASPVSRRRHGGAIGGGRPRLPATLPVRACCLHPPDLHAPPAHIAEHLQRALHTLAAGGRLVKWFQRWWKWKMV